MFIREQVFKIAQVIILYNEFENYELKITAKSTWNQWFENIGPEIPNRVLKSLACRWASSTGT